MSIATEIQRIQADKATIRAKLVALGLATNTDNLNTLASAVAGIVDQGEITAEILEGQTYTIPKGYHNGSGTVKALTDVTGEAEKYKTQAKNNIVPTKQQQSVTPDDGYYALSSVTVMPIPDAYQDVTSVDAEASHVLSPKVFVKADGAVTTGTMPNNGSVNKTLDITVPSYTIEKGYHDGTGVVKIEPETKTVTPKKEAQDVTPTFGKVLSKVSVDGDSNFDAANIKSGVTVFGIAGTFTNDADATAANVLLDKTAYVGGKKVTGTMPNNGSATTTIDGLIVTSVTIGAGYTSGGTISLTDDIETALAAI